MSIALHIQDLVVVRGNNEQAFSVHLPSLTVQSGQVVAITGESGCGKSTLLESIGLLLTPSTLHEFVLGNPPTDIGRKIREGQTNALARIRSQHLGFVLQTGGLLPYLSVIDNILLPRELLGLAGQGPLAGQAIEALELGPLLSKRPSMLSIGERQRVAFARAIAHEPSLILADEPTAALDPVRAIRLFELFTTLVSDMKIAALVVSHDWNMLERFDLPRLIAHTSPGSSLFVKGNGKPSP